MAKKIFVSDDDIRQMLERATSQLKKEKFQSGNVELSMPITSDDRKAELKFSAKAWFKMYALVHKYSTEVEWHGTVERCNESTFLVKDVLIFPHEVSGATVVSDQKAYEEWLDSLDDDTFNAIRFHGHSHVNMQVNPSSVDMGYRKNMLNNFGTPTGNDDYFYIFIITNKKGDMSSEIYDLTNNALYGTADIKITVESLDGIRQNIASALHDRVEEYVDKLTPKNIASVDSFGKLSFTITTDTEIVEDEFLSEFIAEASSVVKERKYSAGTSTYGGSYGGKSYGGYGGYGGYGSHGNSAPSHNSLQSKKPDIAEDDDQMSIDDDNWESFYRRGYDT